MPFGVQVQVLSRAPVIVLTSSRDYFLIQKAGLLKTCQRGLEGLDFSQWSWQNRFRLFVYLCFLAEINFMWISPNKRFSSNPIQSSFLPRSLLKCSPATSSIAQLRCLCNQSRRLLIFEAWTCLVVIVTKLGRHSRLQRTLFLFTEQCQTFLNDLWWFYFALRSRECAVISVTITTAKSGLCFKNGQLVETHENALEKTYSLVLESYSAGFTGVAKIMLAP